MKSLIAAFLLFFSVSLAHADRDVAVGEGGKVMISVATWYPTDVSVTLEAQKYPEAVVRAFNTPDTEVACKVSKSSTLIDMIHSRVDTSTTLMKYSVENSLIDTVNGGTTTEVKIFWFLLPWLAALVFMFVFVKTNNVLFIAAVALCSSLIAGVIPFNAELTSIAALACATFAGLCNRTSAKQKRLRQVFTTGFYLLMYLLLGVVYYPLFM